MAHLRVDKDFETRSSKAYKQAELEVARHLYGVLGDETLLAWILAGGKACYLTVFLREFRGYPAIDRGMGELLWLTFVRYWRNDHPDLSPGEYLDRVVVDIPTRPSQREIDDAWVVESASSDEARRYFGMP